MGNNIKEAECSGSGLRDCLSCYDDGYEMREYYCSNGPDCLKREKRLAWLEKLRAGTLNKIRESKMTTNDEWDFGFSSEEEIKIIASQENNTKLMELRDMILPLLNNLKKNPDMDIIKWEGAQRVKQIDAFITKMNALVEQ